MKTLGEKKGYARALRILEEDQKIREAIGEDPHNEFAMLAGLKLAINILKNHQGQPYPGEKKWRL